MHYQGLHHEVIALTSLHNHSLCNCRDRLETSVASLHQYYLATVGNRKLKIGVATLAGTLFLTQEQFNLGIMHDVQVWMT